MADLLPRVQALVADISYRPDRWLHVGTDGDRVYLQVHAHRPCVLTGHPGVGKGGKAHLSPHMTDGEIVRRAFSLFLAFEEHETREFFRYRGRAIFGPHIHVDALWTVAEDLEVRDG